MFLFIDRIVRNKAAEKAKHVHQQQPQSSSKENSTQNQQSTNTTNSNGDISSSAISGEHRTTSGYSINGILGIPQNSDPISNKKKRVQEQHGECFMTYLCQILPYFLLTRAI